MDTVILTLTTPEAVMFREYMQFHQTFALLCSRGVFDTKNGSVTLHFDQNGTIQNISRQDYLYSRKHEVTQ